jgi:hypothetical protein
MKQVFFLILFFFTLATEGQNIVFGNHEISKISVVKWSDSLGIPYTKGPGIALGATSFAPLDSVRTAYLCNSSDEIIITNRASGKIITRFNVTSSPRDFVFENSLFYVLSENSINVYSETGVLISKESIPSSIKGVTKLARFNSTNYLLYPSGNSIIIDSNLISQELGWATESGKNILTEIIGDNSFKVAVLAENKIVKQRIYSSIQNVAGIFVIGATKNKIVLELQKYISESPVSIERSILEIENSQLMPILYQTIIPKVYYTQANKDFILSTNGEVVQMISAPNGLYIFSLRGKLTKEKNTYPTSIFSSNYHFNDHLIKVD